LDEVQLREFAAFLQTLYDLGGFPSDAEWARQSGVHAVNLSNARTGQGQLDGFNLLRLIRSAADRAALPPEQLAILTARLEAAADDPMKEIVRRLRALETVTTEFQDLTAEAVTRLAEGGSAGEVRPPGEAEQSP
jgi:hypothetical protein